MAHSNTILSQVLKLIPRHEFGKLAEEHDGRRRSDAMTRWTQFVAMSTAQLTGRTSLRDIESTLGSQRHLRYNTGGGEVTRSSLGRANQSLTSRFYESLFSKLYKRCQFASPSHPFRFKNKLFSLDSSLPEVSLKVFPQADYNRLKAAYKLHLGLDHDGLIPAFATITSGKTGDQTHAKRMSFPRGSVVVFDRGCNDYSWHKQLTLQGVFWVTRIRGNAQYRVLERRDIDKAQGITSDQIIEYTAKRSRENNLHPLRRVGYRDPDSGKHYVFITNHFQWSAKTIAGIYKQRWQVELFFKWIKQNLKIKAFVGNTENTVMTQVMIALCTYLTIAFLKFQAKIGHSLQQICRLIHVNLFAKRELMGLFRAPPDPHENSYQQELI